MKTLLFILLFTAYAFTNFNFNQCSGSGNFKQQINYYAGNYENAITVGTIPKGIIGLEINLISDKDVDIRLYADNGDKIVHWPNGILSGPNLKTKSYQNTNIIYSGYNGISGDKGHEFIKIPTAATPTKMVMKAFGYKAGYAMVNYSWTDKEGCDRSQNGSGKFTQEILQNKTNLVGKIPAGLNEVYIKLISEKDIDIQLYGQDNTAIVSWKPQGLLSKAMKANINYHDMNIEWSGYNGTHNKKGNEYIKISGETSEVLTMKVFGYQAGNANVSYTWGNEVANCTNEYTPVCAQKKYYFLPTTYSNSCYAEMAEASILYSGECNSPEPEACTDEYAPVCGKLPNIECITAPCQVNETFSNKCKLKESNATFLYEGECTNSY